MRRRLVPVALVAVALGAPVAAHGHVWEDGVTAGASTSGVSESGAVTHVTQLAGSTGGHVVVEGTRLYMGMYGSGMRIFDISQPASPTELGRWTPADSIIGPRAVADAPPDAAVFDGRHIAVLNGTGRTSRSLPPGDSRTDNTYFLDTTNPQDIELLWTFEGAHDGESHNGDIVDERRWWLPSGGRTATEGGQTLDNGLRIYDLEPLLQTPAAAPAVLFRGDPTKLWAASPYRGDAPVGPAFTHTHDVSVYPDFAVDGLGKRDIALLAEGGDYTNNSGDTGSLFVIDITDPSRPVVLMRWLHDRGSEHHPIRYHHEAQFLDGDPRTVLVTDEDLHNGCSAGGVTTLRLSGDLTSASEVSEWFIADGLPATTTFGPICSVHVFSSHGNLAFFGSYNAGLQVVDFSNPADPKRVGHNVQLGADSWGAQYGRDGIVYVGDFGARGLDVFRYGGPQPDLVVLTPTLDAKRRTVSTRIANQGAVGAPSTVFEFREGENVLSRQTVPALAPGATYDVSMPWDTKQRGSRTVTAVVDVGDRVDESNEENNQRSATFGKR
jgi:CARDB/LVIVD repeat